MLFAAVAAQASPSESIYQITTTGAHALTTPFILKTANYANNAEVALLRETQYITSCQDGVVKQDSVKTGTKIQLTRPNAAEKNEVEIVGVSIDYSDLESMNTLKTAGCTVQLPSVRGFRASTMVPLKNGEKSLIADDLATGTKWFIQRMQ